LAIGGVSALHHILFAETTEDVPVALDQFDRSEQSLGGPETLAGLHDIVE
jgi:hypothetical protein